jgi:hypothetical protein
VVVDFQGTVSGPGSHIDLKIDSGSYVPVASPHKITGLSDGPHTICLKAVNQAGKADPTPACWKFTVINGNEPPPKRPPTQPPLNIPGFPFMFGDRQVACWDEVWGGAQLLYNKDPTWWEFVKEHINGIECKTGERISFTQVQNVVYNMEHGGVGWRPEVTIGSDIYTDNMYVGDNSTDLNKLQIPTNTDPNHIILAADALVREACQVDQIQNGRLSNNTSASEVTENECMARWGR